VRIVVWNIRAGGGQRAEHVSRALRRWRADVAALSEFRATPPNGRHGCRIDQAFVNRELLARVGAVRYTWARRHARDRTDRISDHAALRLDLDDIDPGGLQ
jgi:endonuclease/exonuclease/phosphatase family metal-dependent hydrolase